MSYTFDEASKFDDDITKMLFDTSSYPSRTTTPVSNSDSPRPFCYECKSQR